MWINGACISRGEVGFFFFFLGRGGEAKFGAVSAVTGSPL